MYADNFSVSFDGLMEPGIREKLAILGPCGGVREADRASRHV